MKLASRAKVCILVQGVDGKGRLLQFHLSKRLDDNLSAALKNTKTSGGEIRGRKEDSQVKLKSGCNPNKQNILRSLPDEALSDNRTYARQ